MNSVAIAPSHGWLSSERICLVTESYKISESYI